MLRRGIFVLCSLMEFFRRHFSNIVCFPGANNMKEIGAATPRKFISDNYLSICEAACRKYKFASFRGIFQQQKADDYYYTTGAALCLSPLRLMD
jgi:hypothetical protein